MTNMEKLLDELAEKKLVTPALKWFEHLLVPIDDKSIWKNRKNDSTVNEFYFSKYELWRGRLIKRVFYVCQRWEHKEKVYYRIYEVQRYLAGSKNKLNRWIYNASFAGIRPIYWKRYEDSVWFKTSSEKYSISEVKYNAWNNAYDYTYYSVNRFMPLLKESIHKYCGFEESGLNTTALWWFLYQYEKHPQMEFIAKMGLIDVVSGSLSSMRWSQKGFRLLGLEHKEELHTVKLCSRFGGLKFYLRNKEAFKKYNLDSEHKISIYNILKNRQFADISRKVIDYINNHDLQGKPYNGYYQPTCAVEYIDYIGFCQSLGIPMTSAIKYPEDLHKAHNELQDKVKIVKSKEKTENIQKYVNEVLYKYRYADDDFVITPANSVKDLLEESKVLNHCVRTYDNRYANRETAIFLIRSRDDVHTPLYTLELRNNSIVQCRAKNNRDPSDEGKQFVIKWANKFKIKQNLYSMA